MEVTVWCRAPALTFSVLKPFEARPAPALTDLTFEMTRLRSEPVTLEVCVFFIMSVESRSPSGLMDPKVEIAILGLAPGILKEALVFFRIEIILGLLTGNFFLGW